MMAKQRLNRMVVLFAIAVIVAFVLLQLWMWRRSILMVQRKVGTLFSTRYCGCDDLLCGGCYLDSCALGSTEEIIFPLLKLPVPNFAQRA